MAISDLELNKNSNKKGKNKKPKISMDTVDILCFVIFIIIEILLAIYLFQLYNNSYLSTCTLFSEWFELEKANISVETEKYYTLFIMVCNADAYVISQPEIFLDRGENGNYNAYKKTIAYFGLLLLCFILLKCGVR